MSFAYVYLDVVGKEIERLHDVLKYYPHIRYFLINENKVKNIEGVVNMHSLLFLDASQNEIKTVAFLSTDKSLSYLQEVNLAQNKIKFMDKIVLPRLRRLNMDENRLRSVEFFGGHRRLEVLRLQKNKIKTLEGLDNMVRLKELHLGENRIKTWDSLFNMPSLEYLDLKQNQLKNIPQDLPSLPKLRDLNLSGNRLAKLEEMDNLLSFPVLQSINLEGNPMEEEAGGDLRKSMIMRLCVYRTEDVIEYSRLFEKLNDQEFNEEEQQSLMEEMQLAAEEERQRKAEEERERLEREEEERRQREEEEERKRLEEEEERLQKEKEEQERLEQERLDREEKQKEDAEKKVQGDEEGQDEAGEEEQLDDAGAD